MKHEIDIPVAIEEALSDIAFRTNGDVVSVICNAVVHFVYSEVLPAASGDWTATLAARRAELIDKESHGTISAEERRELAELFQLLMTGPTHYMQERLNRDARKVLDSLL